MPFFKALADETRLSILRLLALTDLRAGELVARLNVPQNVASYHFKILRDLGLLRDRRSAADARDIYYSLDLDRLRALYGATGTALQVAAAHNHDAEPPTPLGNTVRPLRILFLCTHNSARSQLAEGITRYLGGDAVVVYSAGSQPTTVHPLARALLEEWAIDTARHLSKGLEQVAGQPFDYLITVCDRVREQCPVFPDDPVCLHWSIADPTLIADEAAQWRTFYAVRDELATRIRFLLARPHPATGRPLSLPLDVHAERLL